MAEKKNVANASLTDQRTGLTSPTCQGNQHKGRKQGLLSIFYYQLSMLPCLQTPSLNKNKRIIPQFPSWRRFKLCNQEKNFEKDYLSSQLGGYLPARITRMLYSLPKSIKTHSAEFTSTLDKTRRVNNTFSYSCSSLFTLQLRVIQQ